MGYSKKIILFMPSIEDGGVEKNFFNIANYLVKKIDKIAIVTGNNINKKKLDKRINLISFKIKFNLSRRIKYILSIYLLVKELVNTKEKKVVLSFQANVYCIIICKIFGAKIITRSNASIHGWSKNYRLKLYKFFYSFADCLIVNSNALKKEFMDILYLRAVLIYNPLDRERILKLAKQNSNLNFFEDKTLNLLSIGRLVQQKDHLTLIKAVKNLKTKLNIKLIIIGNGPQKKELVNFIKENNLQENIKLIKYTSNPFKYFKKSNFFILSSIFEGLPNVLLEAMLLKKFIISSNCPTGPKEILNSGKFGVLFKPKNHKELAKLILYYSKNKKEYLKKIKDGLKSLKRFDYSRNLNKYLQIINKV